MGAVLYSFERSFGAPLPQLRGTECCYQQLQPKSHNLKPKTVAIDRKTAQLHVVLTTQVLAAAPAVVSTVPSHGVLDINVISCTLVGVAATEQRFVLLGLWMVGAP